jgi:hypothetical protein
MIYPEILNYIEEIKSFNDEITHERKETLKKISNYISQKKNKEEKAELVFICTHNSRRSHFGQIWGQALAAYFNLDHVLTYSGGTEATAFNPNAIKAIKAAGFNVLKSKEHSEPKNPLYEVLYGEDPKIKAFSKIYNDPPNPEKGFCAIMTCNDADENCPVIYGAELRISTPYEDPKKFDNTPEQDQKYKERCRQVASELLYIFSKVN